LFFPNALPKLTQRHSLNWPTQDKFDAMKITFLSPAPNLSGGQRVVAIYADQLLKRGHDVTVVARGYEAFGVGQKLRRLARGKAIFAPPSTSHFDRMNARLIILPDASPITADDVPDADVVIATWWETAFEAVHYPPSKGRKVYFVQHHEVHSHLPQHISGASYLLPFKKITISSWLVDTMRDLYGDPDVALVPNSVDHELFFAPQRCRQPVPTVGLMYAPIGFKGLDVALRAIDIARKSHPDLRVVAFGTEPPTKRFPLPAGSEFHLNPSQDHLRDVYGACDVFVSASRSEGFGLPILEAMACRTPVVATRTGCAEDVIEENKSGFTVDVDDAEALGARLTEVLSMEEGLWQAMSEAAYGKVLKYTWDDATGLFEHALINS
jgi:glycosyltransferase involved in cell wall biosynthesis